RYKSEKGLSLIESAMVLALGAVVTAGVMFYYQSASDANKTQAAISQVMSATSAINGLYIGKSDYSGLSVDVLKNTSAIPENYKTQNGINTPFGTALTVAPAAQNEVSNFGYKLSLTGLPKSACISLATLNLGTSAAGYGIATGNPGHATWSNESKSPITPARASTSCSGDVNVVTYFMK
ncbi:pilus assembly protein, partial [Escherichia coli]|nr:pilus assembly protein [Escherichia coli]EFI3662536.1 pilus assembly protein [Escherichia coli]